MSAEGDKSVYADTPQGWAARWQLELKRAKKALEKFYEVAGKVDEALRDETPVDMDTSKRLCLYPSNMQTIGALLYGRMPQASVSRKFADADDDQARVASEMLERVLNCDIERADDTFAEATRNAMMDWCGPGLGVQRHRYEVGMEPVAEQPAIMGPDGAVMAEAVPATEKKAWEKVNTDYVHYKDFLWGQCHVWHETPWVAFGNPMGQEALIARFPEVGKLVPLNYKTQVKDGSDADKANPWDRAYVWEIWHKETKKVFWVVEGFDKTLDIKDDTLGLAGFFPCQKPLMANLTTTKLVPVSDYKFAQDLYNSVNTLTTRIALLTKAVRVAGAYDKSAGKDLEKLVSGGENKLYPVDNWAMFGEKGGLKGVVDYLPLDQIVSAMQILKEQRLEEIDLIYQVTGQSDLMRGQQTANGTPGEAQVKAKFGSVRIQAKQDELARFASDGQRIRAEIISKHFDPETIIKHSNIMFTPDAELAPAGAQLIKDRMADYRIEIKPEAINLTDFAAQKQEAIEVIGAMATYFSSAQGLVQFVPGSLPFVLEMLKPMLSRLKGGDVFEGIVDRAIKQAQAAAQAPQQQQEDPKMAVERAKLQNQILKGQQDMQKEQFKAQAAMQQVQVELQADAMRERTQRVENVQEAIQKQVATNALKPPPAHNGKGMP
jgi:hypothetical protein